VDDAVIANHRLQRLRGFRNRPEPDLTLGFLARQFKHEVAKPHKQLGALAEAWMRLTPMELLPFTRLDGYGRGTLRVSVTDSAKLYELDRLLREGMQQRLAVESKTPTLRRVKLSVGQL
jgi:hypothetical protein